MTKEVAGLRAALACGEPLLATFVMVPRVELADLLAAAGFRSILLDLEHGPITVSDVPAMAAATRASSTYLVARLGDGHASTIARVLDSGADGVLVPHVETVEEARRVVAASRYPADGERSLNPYVRGAGYGFDGADATEAANRRVAVMVMVEGARGLADVAAICQVPGLDAVFVGPMDLSAALGLPGEPEHPLVLEAIRHVIATAAAAGISTGIYAPTVEAAARWLAEGVRLVAYSADVAMAARAFSAAVAEVNALAVGMAAQS